MGKTPNWKVRNLISSLVLHGTVVTTEARAKNLKREVERLISRSKKLDLTTRRRLLTSFSKDVATRLLDLVVPQFQDRVGGYVRVIKLPHRLGDNAPMGRVEFVEKIREAPSKEMKEKETGQKGAKNEVASKVPSKGKPTQKSRRVRKTNEKNKSNKSK